ncbi:hypothetical protein LguiA_001054 [Lonicera macranthoides]
MANNYNKEKLVKVGTEGFAMLEECLGRKAAGVNPPQRLLSPPPQVLWRYPHQPQEPRVYVVAQFSYPTKDNMSAMDCYEVAKIYGGTLLVDYPKRKPTRMAYY